MSRDLDAKRTATGTAKLGDKTINTETWEGFTKTLTVSMNGKESFKASKFQRVFGQAAK